VVYRRQNPLLAALKSVDLSLFVADESLMTFSERDRLQVWGIVGVNRTFVKPLKLLRR